MAVVESRLKTGTLSLGGTMPVDPLTGPPTGGTEFSCQATNVTITPSFSDEGDMVETLCGDTVLPTTKTDWTLTGTSIQDFDNPASFQKYTWDNNLVEVPFLWEPNASDVAFYGMVQVRALVVGGDVNTRLTSDFEWSIKGMPTAVWPTGGAASDTQSTDDDDTDADSDYDSEQDDDTDAEQDADTRDFVPA
jgi:hypothetical protein